MDGKNQGVRQKDQRESFSGYITIISEWVGLGGDRLTSHEKSGEEKKTLEKVLGCDRSRVRHLLYQRRGKPRLELGSVMRLPGGSSQDL